MNYRVDRDSGAVYYVGKARPSVTLSEAKAETRRLKKMKAARKTIRSELTQEAKIMQHLRLKGSISGIEALHLFKVRDLPKRISVIRAAGASVAGAWSTDTTGARYMRYFLVKAVS